MKEETQDAYFFSRLQVPHQAHPVYSGPCGSSGKQHSLLVCKVGKYILSKSNLGLS